MTDFYTALLSTALVGTERRRLATDAAPAPLVAPLVALQGRDAATALLDAAALSTVYRRAGRQPTTAIPLPSPAPAETRPEVPPAAGRRLAALISSDYPEVLSEWLALAAERGLRVPVDLLPALLELGRRNTTLRSSILAAGGSRIRWLAAQQQSWAYLLQIGGDGTAVDDVDWEFGDPGRRLDHLSALRRADPAAARLRLSAAWATEEPAMRAALLDVLRIGLSDADEEFLQAAMADRRKEVRSTAADLLARLSTSGYRQRMAQRARGLVRLGDRRKTLEVTLPTGVDAAMRSDGLLAGKKLTEDDQRRLLTEIVGATPLDTWDALESKPERFVAMTIDGPSVAFFSGLAVAAARERNMRWATALLSVAGLREDRGPVHLLMTGLPNDDRCRLVAEVLDDTDRQLVLDRLYQCASPWPVELGEVALRQLRRHRGELGWRTYRWARLLGTMLPVKLLPDAIALAEKLTKDPTFVGLTELGTLAELRQQMHEEFA